LDLLELLISTVLSEVSYKPDSAMQSFLYGTVSESLHANLQIPFDRNSKYGYVWANENRAGTPYLFSFEIIVASDILHLFDFQLKPMQLCVSINHFSHQHKG
jgi:hypothetical protein